MHSARSLMAVVIAWSWQSQGFAVEAPRCGTAEHALLERLTSPGIAGVRPPEVGFLDSESLPIRVHYSEGVTVDYARQILGYAEDSWRAEFEVMGFLPPHADGGEGGSDAFDFYIVTTLQPGIGGYTSFSGFFSPTPRADAYGYTVLAHDLKAPYIRGVVAHELSHGSQMAYDWWEHVSAMEGSATWIIEHVFPDEDFYWRYFVYYNRKPWQALNFISLADPYQYGSGMFLMFLDEHYGDGTGAFVRRIWEYSVQDDYNNEPDYLDAIDQLLADQGGLHEAFHLFAEWRILLGSHDDGQHFRESGIWGQAMDPALDFDGEWPLDAPARPLLQPLEPWSHAFLRFKPSATTPWAPFKVEFAGKEAIDLRVWWAVYDHGVACSGTSPLSRGRVAVAIDPTCGGAAKASADREILIALSNMADEAFDADTSAWHPSPLTWRAFGNQ